MKKTVVLAVLATALALAATAAGAGPGAPTLTMRFLEVQTQFGGNIPEGQEPKPGDRFWFHSELYTWKGSKRGAHFGHTDTTAMVLPGGIVQVTSVGTLPSGTVSVVGLAGDRGIFKLAVVGGTGAYATARGEVVIRSIGGERSNTSADTLRLWS
jgi:hypothetical protein